MSIKAKRATREDIIKDLQAQFPDIKFEYGEYVNKLYSGLIFLDEIENLTEDDQKIIISEGSFHPDFEIIVEKFGAKISRVKNSNNFLIGLSEFKKENETNKVGFSTLRDKLLDVIKKH